MALVWLSLAFHDANFDRFYADTEADEPFDGSLHLRTLAGQFEANNSNLASYARLADIGDDLKLLGQLPDDGLGDLFGRIHQPEAGVVLLGGGGGFGRFHGFLLGLGRHGNSLTPGDGRDDADFVAVFERRFLVLEEADIFLIHIDIHEAAHATVLIQQPFLDAGIAGLQFVDGPADGVGGDFHNLFVVRELAERSWDTDVHWHNKVRLCTLHLRI